MISATTIVTGLAVLASFCCSPAMAACNTANVKGAYGHIANAMVPTGSDEPGSSTTPLVEVGLLTFDGQGGITGSASGVKEGGMTPVTVTGTYSVKSDCTLMITGYLSVAGITVDTITLQGVVVQHGTRIDAVVTGSGSGVQTGSGVFDSVQ